MVRLFVAIRPPGPIRDTLLGLMGGVEGARWQSEAQLHLTLAFIGEVDRHMAQDCLSSLLTILHPPARLQLSGGGMFEKGGKVHTLWAGVAPDEGLVRLHAKVAQALQRAGIMLDARAWQPHITLARGSMRSDASAFAASLTGLSSAPFIIDHMGLYESSLGKSGADYTLMERFPLAG
jgi:2'-5' RNA ligase